MHVVGLHTVLCANSNVGVLESQVLNGSTSGLSKDIRGMIAEWLQQSNQEFFAERIQGLVC